MPTSPRLVFFDVDGVLIDSLPQHLQLCRDKVEEFGLKLNVPGVDEFRELIRTGMKVSPIRDFFLAVGFPSHLVERAVADYEKKFTRLYRPKAFSGVEKMLAILRKSGLKLGIVTFNTRANVVPALRNSIDYFDDRCLFFFDRHTELKSKQWCLVEGARILSVGTQECIYVGDQPGDATAAADAGTRFLGVTYGWGISQDDRQYDSAKSILEIPEKLMDLHARS